MRRMWSGSKGASWARWLVAKGPSGEGRVVHAVFEQSVGAHLGGGPVDALEQVVHGLAVVGDIVLVIGGAGQAGALSQWVDEVDFEAVAAVGLHQVFDRAIGVLAHRRAAGTEKVVRVVGACGLEAVCFYEKARRPDR